MELGEPPVELIRGRTAIGQRFRQIQSYAGRELLILNGPPTEAEPDDLESRRGVRCRAIYDRDALRPAGRMEPQRRLAVQGTEARVLANVPLRLVIADRRIGLAPQGIPGDETAVLVRSSALLDGLVTLFETLWERATPDPPVSPDQQLLALLAAGLTDQAIARTLGVALRTVERRVRRMMDGLGARTRFQAGLRAATRGLDIPLSQEDAAP